MKRLTYLSFLLILCLSSCEQEHILLNEETGLEETTRLPSTSSVGQNTLPGILCSINPTYVQNPTPYVIPAGDNMVDYTVTVDGNPREFRLYVPPGYPGNGPYPIVFMFHGTGQDMNKIMRSTRWQRVSRNGGNFIAVYPQGESYLMNLDNGNTGWRTKWMTENARQQMVDSTQALDDVKFFNIMLNSIKNLFRVNCNKIYAAGFSNGGAFVKSELRHNFGNQLAATVSTGGIGTPVRGFPTEGQNCPHLETCGDEDQNKLERYGYPPGDSLPIDPTTFLTSPFAQNLENFALDCGLPAPIIPATATTSVAVNTTPAGVPYWAEIRFFNANNEYRFRMLHQLTHAVPTPWATPSYPQNYTRFYWDFMNAYSL